MSVSELESLRLEKRNLEERIKELERKNCGCIVSGCVKLDREICGTARIDRWYVAVNFDTEKMCGHSFRPKTWKKIIDGASKKEVIDQIPDMIKALQTIYDEGVAKDDSARITRL